MTKREISEIFSLWSLNWPNAEMFQGDKNLLNARITLYANLLEDVSYWLGRKGAAISIKTRRFPPTVADYREDINRAKAEVQSMADFWYESLRSALDFQAGEGLNAVYSYLLPEARAIVDEMGGIDQIFVAEGLLNKAKFDAAYIRTKMREDALISGDKRIQAERRLQ